MDSLNPWVATDAIKLQIFGPFSPETALWLHFQQLDSLHFESR